MSTAVRVPRSVSVLEEYVAAGVFDAGEVQLCAAVTRLVPEVSDLALLGLAVAARGPRLGHVCIELDRVDNLMVDRGDEAVTGIGWPRTEKWLDAIAASPICAGPEDYADHPVRPLVIDGSRLYLQRTYHLERSVASDIGARAGTADDDRDPDAVDAALDAIFGPTDPGAPDLQRVAAHTALTHHLTVLAGGPGTGKTHTIARILAAALHLASTNGRTLDIALTAPTGKAASRMTEALHGAAEIALRDGVIDAAVAERLKSQTARTIHQLLGAIPNKGFRRNADNPLPHDLVIIDETSMVSLPMMAALLAAVRPQASLLLVGDPNQLASIEAGTVMSDLVGPTGPGSEERPDRPLAGRVVTLSKQYRHDEDSAIGDLALAIKAGDADATISLLDGPSSTVRWVREADGPGIAGIAGLVVDQAEATILAARQGDAPAALDAMCEIKVLAATRHFALGLYDWTDRVEGDLTARLADLRTSNRWYVGRPVLITQNDHANDLRNGDTGVVVRHDDGIAVAFPAGEDVRYVPTVKLDRIDTWWAMTIHKSQGSEFPHAVVSLPPASSPILTRELLYTGVTRGKKHVTIVGSEEALRAAIARPITRASGLRDRLWPA